MRPMKWLKHIQITLASLILAFMIHGSSSSQNISDVDPAFVGNLVGNEVTDEVTPPIWHSLTQLYHLRYDSSQSRIQEKIKEYVDQRDYFNRIMRNSRPYLFYVLSQVRKYNLPAEVALLPLVESDYNPFGYSSTGATGLWQIMPGTASGYGLRINWWYDGRRSVVDSTPTALNFLIYLHNHFNDWPLALAAYDSGQGTIDAAIRYNREHHRSTDFWSLPLSQETRDYVPKLLALAQIVKNPNKYHMKLPYIPDAPYFASVKVSQPTNLTTVAKLAGVNINNILALNPGYRRFSVPDKTYSLILPIDNVSTYEHHLVILSSASTTNALVSSLALQSIKVNYQVHQGDSLSRIAKQYHVTTAALKSVNHIQNNLLHTNQQLLIPQKGTTILAQNIIPPPGVKHPTKVITEDGIPGPKRVVYTVQKGDTLKVIGRQYHVSPDDLWFWNKLNNKPKKGTQLIIWEPSKHSHVDNESHSTEHHQSHHHAHTHMYVSNSVNPDLSYSYKALS